MAYWERAGGGTIIAYNRPYSKNFSVSSLAIIVTGHCNIKTEFQPVSPVFETFYGIIISVLSGTTLWLHSLNPAYRRWDLLSLLSNGGSWVHSPYRRRLPESAVNYLVLNNNIVPSSCKWEWSSLNRSVIIHKSTSAVIRWRFAELYRSEISKAPLQ